MHIIIKNHPNTIKSDKLSLSTGVTDNNICESKVIEFFATHILL